MNGVIDITWEAIMIVSKSKDMAVWREMKNGLIIKLMSKFLEHYIMPIPLNII